MIPLRMRWVGLSTTRIAEDAELLESGGAERLQGAADRLRVDQPGHAERDAQALPRRRRLRRGGQEAARPRHRHPGLFRLRLRQRRRERVRADGRVRRQGQDRSAALRRGDAVSRTPACYRRLEAEGRLLHKNWSLYDVEHVVFQPKQMSPERLQEGLEWAWRQSYCLAFNRSTRITGSRCVLPLSVSLNLGYRHYANHLREKTWPVYRDEAYMAEQAERRVPAAVGASSLPGSAW